MGTEIQIGKIEILGMLLERKVNRHKLVYMLAYLFSPDGAVDGDRERDIFSVLALVLQMMLIPFGDYGG